MKTAIVYDRVNKWGGAERVLLALKQLFPDAPLYTSVYDSSEADWAKGFDIRTSFLQSLSLARKKHELFALFMPLAFEEFVFDDYDLVISVTSEAAKGIITKPKTLHICYCLTPTRYLWSGYNEYFKNPIFRFITKPIVKYLQIWDKTASKRPDVMISISDEVRKRVRNYYDRDTDIIYPPSTLTGESAKSKRGEYLLIVSRLVPYKRIDLAIKACDELGLPLKIIGTGSEGRNLRKIAGKNIEFLGRLSDEKVKEYYANCRAIIFPGVEDFGLTVIEAQQFGKPVLAYKQGGAVETIVEGKTGMFFYPQTVEALVQTLPQFYDQVFDAKSCIENAKKFHFDVFKSKFMSLIENYQK